MSLPAGLAARVAELLPAFNELAADDPAANADDLVIAALNGYLAKRAKKISGDALEKARAA